MTSGTVAPSNLLAGRPAVWRIAAVSAACAFMVGILPVALPIVAGSFDLTNAAAATVVSAFALGRIVVPLPSGWAAHRWGAARTTDIGVAICLLAAVIALLGGGLVSLLGAMFGAGLGVGVVMTSSIALILGVSAEGSLGRMATINQWAINVGHVLAPLAGGIAAVQLGVRGPFAAYLAVAVCGAALWWSTRSRLALNAPPVRDMAQAATRRPGRNATVVVAGALVFFWSLSGVSQTLVPLYAQQALAMDEVEIGRLLMVPAVVGLVVIAPLGMAVDRWGAWPVFASALVAVASSAAVLAVWGVTAAVIVALVLAGFAKAGAVAPEAALVAGMVGPGSQGVAAGLFRSALAVGTFVGPISLAALADAFGFRTAFWVGGGVVAVVAVWVQLRRRAGGRP